MQPIESRLRNTVFKS